MKTIHAVTLALAAASMAACAGGPAETPGRNASPESFESQAARMAERDPIEAFRLLRKGAGLEDAACALKFLSFAERREATLSQREYARLFIEKQLAAGALRGRAAELHHRLALSWNFLDPRSPAKVRENVEALARAGITDEMAASAVLHEMIRTTGARVDLEAARRKGRAARDLVQACDATPADDSAPMVQHGPSRAGVRAAGGPTVVMDVTAWAGGNDKLLQASGVLAFVVNAKSEPVFRGRNLWIRNAGDREVTYSVPAAGVQLRELGPGAEETVALEASEPVTSGIDLTVRYAWRR